MIKKSLYSFFDWLYNSVWIKILSGLLYIKYGARHTEIEIVCFSLKYPFAIQGNSNQLLWQVKGASQVKLNGKFVHPIEGDLTFVTENDTKFIISCKNRWSTVQKELEIQTNHYSQKRDFNFRRLASQPILLFQKAKQHSIKPISNDMKLSKLSSRITQQSILNVRSLMSDRNFIKINSLSVFYSIHNNFEESRNNYDQKYEDAMKHIFDKNEVSSDYKNKIDTYLK